MGRRGGSAPAFRGESMCLGRAPSVTRKRDRKVKGMEGKEGLKQTRLCYHRTTVWGSVLGVSALCLGSWDSLVSVPGIGDETSGLRRAGHGGNTCSGSLGKGGASLSPHLTFSWNPSSRVRQTPCLKIPIALVMFSQKRNRGFAVKGPALQRCERGQWELEFLPLGT
jgi:hypothetical protein